MAKARIEQYKMDAQALSSKVKAMEEQGNAVVYKILAEKYKNMTIELQPYSIDANPQRVQMENLLRKPNPRARNTPTKTSPTRAMHQAIFESPVTRSSFLTSLRV